MSSAYEKQQWIDEGKRLSRAQFIDVAVSIIDKVWDKAFEAGLKAGRDETGSVGPEPADRLGELEAQRDAVIALHTKISRPISAGTGPDVIRVHECKHDNQIWPCATVTALGGTTE